MTDDGSEAAQLDARRHLYERFAPATVAVSTDGREVHVYGTIDAGLRLGSYAIIEEPGRDEAVAVQVRAVGLVERQGPELQVATDVPVPGSEVISAAVRLTLRAVKGTAAVLGSLKDGTFRPLDHVDPFGERRVRPARLEETRAIAEGLLADHPGLPIGVHRAATPVPASLRSKGFARHTFMCGQSGSGKTYTTGVVFERLLAWTTLPIVVLDLNSDHVHLGALSESAGRSSMPREEARFAEVAGSVRVARARGLESDYVLCADFSDLTVESQALVLRLHPIRDLDEFDSLRRLSGSLKAPYSVDDLVRAAADMAPDDPLAARLVTRIGNLGLADWDVWRREGEVSMTTADLRNERCVVFDLGSLPRPDERTAVAAAVLGERWRTRHERRPVLLAIDEAHNLLPAVTDDPLLRATTDLGALIAGEGRKFGLHLFVSTQRPAKVHPNVVTQCDNLILMRMNGVSDVDDLVSMFSHVPEAMVRSALTFGLGEALVAGPLSPVPTVVQVGNRFSAEGGGDVPTTWASPGPRQLR